MRAALQTTALRAFAGFCLILILNVPALAASVGSVVGVLGNCVIDSGGNRAVAKLSAAVQVGDTVEVPDGGRLRLRMADGSVITIAAGTRMQITAYGVTPAGQRQEAKLSLQEGLVRAQVPPAKGTPAKFEIDTASGVTAVRSTDFFVETQTGWVQTVVLSGSVTLTSAATGAVTTLSARQGARLETGNEPANPRAWTNAEINALIARTSFPQNNPPPTPRKRARSDNGGQSNQDGGSGPGNYPPPGYTPPQTPNYPTPGYSPPPYVPPPAYVPPPPVYSPPPRYPPPRYFPPGGGYNPPRGGGGGYDPPGRPGGTYPPRGGGGYQPPERGSGRPNSDTGSAGPLQ